MYCSLINKILQYLKMDLLQDNNELILNFSTRMLKWAKAKTVHLQYLLGKKIFA